MTSKAILAHKNMKAALGGALVALLGWQLSVAPLGQFLADLSYDLPFVFVNPGGPPEVMLVEMDEISHRDLRQEYGATWDRRLHARWLDYLRADGADVVVFDVVFPEPGPDAAADKEFAQAIRAHGRVALAANLEDTLRPGLAGPRILPPTDVLRAATAHWGPAQAKREADGVVRTIYPGTEQMPSLAWVSATLAKAPVVPLPGNHFEERWVRYFGPGGTLARVSYSEATNQPAGFFRGKAVFIGGRPKTGFVTEEKDEFRTSWRLQGQPQISGLELNATEFLNLTRGDFLKRLAAGQELCLLALLGILAGGSLACARPLRAAIFAVAGVAAVLMIALLLFQSNRWFNWAVVALVQIPCALAWSLGWQWWHLKKEKDWLESPLPDLWDETPSVRSDGQSSMAAAALPTPSDANPAGLPVIPDHELLRLVGRGAYGDVWLARDVLGSFHAVKIIRRAAFDHAAPYDREFRGLQKFTPISRQHPGLVHILQVGRNSAENFFYYVMEAGDDEEAGSTIDPTAYTPRNLGRDLHRRIPLPPAECLEILAALCDALEFLHSRGLIHRDIKPANIIFVNGRPKLADIGLVTEISEHRHAVSKVGTEGYLPPEGPGTAAGDVFALGKLLEEMLRPREQHNPLPGDFARETFNPIVLKACAENPAERFATAGAMRDALVAARQQIHGDKVTNGLEN